MTGPRLELRPSSKLIGLLILIHFGAAICAGLSNCPFWIKITLIIFCPISFFKVWFKYLPPSTRAITYLWEDADGEWKLQNGRGEIKSASLKGSSLVTRFLIILNFKVADQRLIFPVVLFPDTLDVSDFRRLSVYLHTLRNLAN